MTNSSHIAYFSMEIGLETAIPTYAGGLGILAGDFIRSAADLGIPLVAVTLLHRKGYFHQALDETGWQTEQTVCWSANDFLAQLPQSVTVEIESRTVLINAWRYEVTGVTGKTVPVFFLDTDQPENSDTDRSLTQYLYGGDDYYRLCQEVILGVGGVRMLRALQYDEISRFHMNEGHASLLVLELLQEGLLQSGSSEITPAAVEAVRERCVFTTHTPVPAGHDQFSQLLASRIFGPNSLFEKHQAQCCYDGLLNMTHLALDNSHFINGVAKRHRDISQQMFGQYSIDAITNGVHVSTWACKPMQTLFDQYISGWREDNPSLRYALSIPKDAIWKAHELAKKDLLTYVNRTTNAGMDTATLTIGFARRATPYKRPDLLFNDVARLNHIAKNVGALQIIFAGKAHPHDQTGKELIQTIHRMKQCVNEHIKLVYLAGYDMSLAKLLTAGADLWLNTPRPPLEASGTSGMKAAINGVPSLSILDGWWIEGCIEGVTGWAIGDDDVTTVGKPADALDANYLYDKLEQTVIPLYYSEQLRFMEVMRHCIGINASFFNTERMLNQYVTRAYFL